MCVPSILLVGGGGGNPSPFLSAATLEPFSYILKETCDRLSLKGAGMSHTGSRLCASVISKLADVCITSSPYPTHQHAGANPNICRRRRRPRREINVKTQNFVHFAHYFPLFPSDIRIY